MTSNIRLSAAQSREIDRVAIEDYGVPGVVLMENAGRGVAEILVEQEVQGEVAICCGRGNNAGDGFVIARHLDLRGVEARILLFCWPEELAGDAAINFKIAERAGLPIELLALPSEGRWHRVKEILSGAEWVVDALLGTGAKGDPRPPFDTAIASMNASKKPILAVDVPSGLDCDRGVPAKRAVRATRTCTFVAEKQGFAAPEAQEYLGRVDVVDIGAPRLVLHQVLSEFELDGGDE